MEEEIEILGIDFLSPSLQISPLNRYNVVANRLIATVPFETDWISIDAEGIKSRISVLPKDRGGVFIGSQLPQNDRSWLDYYTMSRGSSIEKNSFVFNSQLKDCQIVKSNVRDSIINNCTITNAYIYNCKLDNCKIEGVDLRNRKCFKLTFYKPSAPIVEPIIVEMEKLETIFTERLKDEVINILNEEDIPDKYNERYAYLMVADRFGVNRYKIERSSLDIKWARDFVAKKGNVARIEHYWSHIKEA